MNLEKNRRVLVVDDNKAIHEDFRKVIGIQPTSDTAFHEASAALFDERPALNAPSAAYEIDSAYQGQEALAMVQKSVAEGRPYAVAFVDVRMPPGWDGIETVKRLWEVDSHLQVVICTAYTDYSWNDMIEVLGETDQLLILKKPFDNVEARQLVSALTAKWRLTKHSEQVLDDLHHMVQERTATLERANEQLRDEITQRQRLDEAKHQIEVRTAAILKSALDSIISIDDEGRILEFNPAAERAFGYTRDEIIGRNVSLLIPSPHREQHDGYLTEYHRTGKSKMIGAIRQAQARRKDGTNFPIEIAVAEVPDSGSKMFTGVLRDLTERRKLEAQLTQAQKLEAVGQLAAGIAHEINTPTQYVGDNTQFLRDAFNDLDKVLTRCDELVAAAQNNNLNPELTAEVARCLDDANVDYLREEIPKAIDQSLEGIQRVSQIVRSMKDFAYQGVGKMVAVDLNRNLESTLTVARNEWKYVAETVTDFDPDLPPVTCLPGDINQVFLNLIVNAAHAITDVVGDGSEKGTIRISTRRDGDQVEVRISDTGTGIPEAIRSRIFDPFFTTKQVGKGTGQGLAITHNVVVEKHDGSITFESTLGEGTTFIVRLPIKQAGVTEESPEHEDQLAFTG